MTEPSVQVPVSLTEHVRWVFDSLNLGPKVVERLDALLSQPGPSAEPTSNDAIAGFESYERLRQKRMARSATPPRIADMVPGTTFVGSLVESHDPEGMVLRFHVLALERLQDDRGNRWITEDIDPSTIRDVTPPPATPGATS